MKTIFRVEFGSHLYGTNTSESDTDFKSVHIPDGRDILLQRVKDSIGRKTKTNENERNRKEDIDDESYSLQRYLSLLAEGQTVAIDMLFAPKPLISDEIWSYIRFYRDRVLTKKAGAFVGYCRTQANKYGIKGSRVAAAKEAVEFFRWHLEGSPLPGIIKVGDILKETSTFKNEHMRIVKKETTPDHIETYFECCNRMVGFKNTA